MSSIIHIANLKIGYSPDAILSEINNLQIEKGDIVSIIGKSGIFNVSPVLSLRSSNVGDPLPFLFKNLASSPTTLAENIHLLEF